MKKFFILSLAAAGMLAAQITGSFNFNTGDASLDLSLNNLNVTAKADVKIFTADLSAAYAIPVVKLDSLITVQKMEPAEVFMIAELATAAKKPIDEAVKVYTANKTKGWGAIAKELGVKPGSPEFKALKTKADSKNEKAKGKGKGAGKKK
ncbi:MAG: hypothetical protein AABZ39_03115 [Spirochaetota bacterium]